jgi:hypothetical protein
VLRMFLIIFGYNINIHERYCSVYCSIGGDWPYCDTRDPCRFAGAWMVMERCNAAFDAKYSDNI